MLAASAASITNQDERTQKLTITEDGKVEIKRLQSGSRLKDICRWGCVIRLNDDAERDFVLDGGEQVSIERGLIYYDGEEEDSPSDNSSEPSGRKPSDSP